MFDQIMFARIGWGPVYQGEDLEGNFRMPNETGSWWERFNFRSSIKNRCYGYIPPMGPSKAPPNPKNHDGWLVVFVAQQDGQRDGLLVPVGWYEEASFEEGYTKRLEKDPDHAYEYVLSTKKKDAYLIPKGERSSFPHIPTDHFKRIWVYARSPQHRDRWRHAYADLAERIVSRKRPGWRII